MRRVTWFAAAFAVLLVGAGNAAAVCTTLGCARTLDGDADGVPDGAFAAWRVAEASGNGAADADGFYHTGDVVVGDEHDGTFHVLILDAWAETGAGHPTPATAWVGFEVWEIDAESGRGALVGAGGVFAEDSNGDGVIDHIEPTTIL